MSSEPVRQDQTPPSRRLTPAAGALALGVIAPPLVALLNQELIYGGTAPLCAGTLHAPLRAVPVFCLVVVCILAASALATYRRSAAGAPGDGASAERAGRTRFLAGVAMMTGGVAALVILAQWLAVIMFQPCLQA